MICTAGTAVEIGENSPRISTGASGLGSQVSNWLGPPRIQRMITELARRTSRPVEAAWDSRFSSCGSDSPADPSMPTLSRPRRSNRRWSKKSRQPERVDLGI